MPKAFTVTGSLSSSTLLRHTIGRIKSCHTRVTPCYDSTYGGVGGGVGSPSSEVSRQRLARCRTTMQILRPWADSEGCLWGMGQGSPGCVGEGFRSFLICVGAGLGDPGGLSQLRDSRIHWARPGVPSGGPHGSLRPLVLGPSTGAHLAGGPSPPRATPMGGKSSHKRQKAPLWGWTFPLEQSHSILFCAVAVLLFWGTQKQGRKATPPPNCAAFNGQ